MNTQGAIQRAELFRDVDELKAWRKSFDMKQNELIAWQAMVMERLQALDDAINTTLKGCNVLVDTDTALGDRIDIVNKRLRTLETITKHLPEIEDLVTNHLGEN